jgi:hypothetical protein
VLYRPPKDLLEVLAALDFEEALSPEDERYVDTEKARGAEPTLDRFARKFGLLLRDGRFVPPTQRHVLFFGHTGSGKTTELRRYSRALSGADRFFVVEVDITTELDRNNLQYADTLMAMARTLLDCLARAGARLDTSALTPLEKWFTERVLSEEDAKELTAKIETGVSTKQGIPFLLDLFAKFTAAFKTNVTYKESLRRVVRNTFTQFAEAFNSFLRDAEMALASQGLGRRFLFIIDGTDKLRGEDTRQFFVHDAEQLLVVEAHVVYAAPLALKYEGNLTSKLDADLVLPMIKLCEPDRTPFDEGRRTMQAILLRRADRSLFASDAVIDTLVAHSGGHPRELLRLLKLCCEYSETNTISAETADQAVRKLASEYRRFLEPDDYVLLADIDRGTLHTGNDDRVRRLLYSLALLEYDDGAWRCSHPVVRVLDGYLAAAQRLKTPPQSGNVTS